MFNATVCIASFTQKNPKNTGVSGNVSFYTHKNLPIGIKLPTV